MQNECTITIDNSVDLNCTLIALTETHNRTRKFFNIYRMPSEWWLATRTRSVGAVVRSRRKHTVNLL